MCTLRIVIEFALSYRSIWRPTDHVAGVQVMVDMNTTTYQGDQFARMYMSDASAVDYTTILTNIIYDSYTKNSLTKDNEVGVIWPGMMYVKNANLTKRDNDLS